MADGAFPLVVFGHGHQQSYADYACIREALVPHGYSVAFPDRLSASPAIGIDAYARDLLFVAAAMRALAGDPASRYFGRIAEGTALLGPRGSTLGSELQNAVTVAYLLPWLAFHLHGDAAAWGEFVRRLDTDPRSTCEGRP
ncbi:hypothetical protein H5T54_03855 [Candidatus Bipolaricaulota bacterium]|nr:hypothetical protein [Candidatus Bipolaricaulota bacterium]